MRGLFEKLASQASLQVQFWQKRLLCILWWATFVRSLHSSCTAVSPLHTAFEPMYLARLAVGHFTLHPRSGSNFHGFLVAFKSGWSGTSLA